MQVFVANPNKTEKIAELLQHNKDKLLRYLGDFHTDKGATGSYIQLCNRFSSDVQQKQFKSCCQKFAVTLTV